MRELWHSPRVSDGVGHVHVRARSSTHLDCTGRIWAISDGPCNTLHAFWLIIDRRRTGFTWRLRFDLDDTQRRARMYTESIEAVDDPSTLRWRHTLDRLAVV